MSEIPEIPPYHERPRWAWISLGVLLAIGLVCGFIGYLPDEPQGPAIQRVSSAIYQTAQLFVFHTPEWDHLPSPWLDVARWAAAFAILGTVVYAFWQVIGMELRLRYFKSHTSDHVIICGAGWRGLALACDYLQIKTDTDPADAKPTGPKPKDTKPTGPKPAVIVLESDPDAHGIKQCKHWKIPYLIGDATDPKFLCNVAPHKARALIAVCGSDDTNMEIALQAGDLAGKSRKSKEALKCHVHIANDEIRSVVRQNLLTFPGRHIDVSTFGIDIHENTARHLFQGHPLDWTEIGHRRAHLFIIGFEEAGKAILMQALRIGHFAHGKLLKVTVVDPHAKAMEGDFLNQYPALPKIADVDWVPMQAHDTALAALVSKESREPDFLPTCIICLPDEKLNLATAVKLAAAADNPHLPILWWHLSRSWVGSLNFHKGLSGMNVRHFGVLNDICKAEFLDLSEIDKLACAIHDCYLEEQTGRKQTLATNPTFLPWEELPDNLKHSNRMVADHIEVKLRAIGYYLVKKESKHSFSLSEAEVDILAKMEHARYCAERFMDGWKAPEEIPHQGNNLHGPPPQKDPIKKINPTLVEWGELNEGEAEKDRDQVRNIPRIIALAKWSVTRHQPAHEFSSRAE